MLCVQIGDIVISFPKHTKKTLMCSPKAVTTLAFMQRDCKGDRAVTKALIGGGGGCIFIYSRSARRISFEINSNDNGFQKKFIGQNANI